MKKRILQIFFVLIIVLSLFWIWTGNFVDLDSKNVNFEITLSSDVIDEYQIFYTSEKNATKQSFSNGKSCVTKLQKTGEDDWFSFAIPASTRYVRVDSGNLTSQYTIKAIEISYGENKYALDVDNVYLQNDISKVDYISNSEMIIESGGKDSYLVWDIQHDKIMNIIQQNSKNKLLIFRCVVSILIIGFSAYIYSKRQKVYSEAREVYVNRKIIRDLSKSDFKNKFAGSYLGVFWAFVQPIVIVTIYWFIFSVGFKSAPVDDCPYLLWLVSGICPWFFFNDALNAGTNSLYDYSYIVKKVAFKIDIIPVIKIISCAFVHLFFIALVILVFCLHGQYPSIYVIQVFYYSFCTFALTLGITYLTSALAVFFKDTSQIVGILLQFGMWMVPIMYSESMFGDKVKGIFKLNPVYYLVNGYRDAFISNTWFWERGMLTVYFWGITVLLFAIGVLVFKRLRPHFADVI